VKKCSCGGKTRCLDSRSNAGGNTRRRYECKKCGKKIYTLELEIKKGMHANADLIANDESIKVIKQKIFDLLDQI
jgi:transcriptional regulator NrdR family protein